MIDSLNVNAALTAILFELTKDSSPKNLWVHPAVQNHTEEMSFIKNSIYQYQTNKWLKNKKNWYYSMICSSIYSVKKFKSSVLFISNFVKYLSNTLE